MLARLGYAKLKDPFSSVSHGVGAILAVVGTIALIVVAFHKGVALAGSLVYAAGLIFVYLASTLYHARHSKSPWPQRLDHMAIYVMIAGTYTPVCLLSLPRSYGIPMLIAEWTLAILGLVLNIFFGGGHNVLRVVLYLSMGWMAVLAMGPLKTNLGSSQLIWLVAGGIFYTLGTVIYATERPRLWPGKFDAHDLWHLFVLAASGFHYALVISLASQA
jgi:hemolysin III